jgi:predicted small integral membrane protein
LNANLYGLVTGDSGSISMQTPSGFGWMAWTWQTAVFWLMIASLIFAMAIWERFDRGGNPRRGMLGLTTTRGDRLFISLLTAAYLHLLWLAFTELTLWWVTAVSVGSSVLIFRKT